jgi:hypothetical protein
MSGRGNEVRNGGLPRLGNAPAQPAAAGPILARLILPCALLLSACGGAGGGGGAERSDAPVVTALSAAPVMYAEPMRIEFGGEHLGPSITIRLSGACESEVVIELRAEPQTGVASCTPDSLGPILIEALSVQGEPLRQLQVEVKAPRVEMAIGPAGSAASFTFELDPGGRGSGQRPWVDLFLHRLRSGEYDGTVLHEVRGGVLHQGGCYRIDSQGIPRASILSEPPEPVTPSLLGSNIKETLAMSSDLCGPSDGAGQPGSFALHFADNASGSLTDKDSDRFVVIGRLQAGDASAWNLLANQRPRLQPVVGWPLFFPADPEAVTIRRIERTQ